MGGQKGTLGQAEKDTAGRHGQRGHTQSGQWGHGQAGRQQGPRWHRHAQLTVAQSSVGHRDWRVRGATLRQGGHWGHPGPNIQGTHTLTGREVSEGHTGTGVVSGSHTGSEISRVTRGLFSRWAAVPEAAPLTVSLAAQRRESAVKEMQPESARPKPLSTRW